MKENRPDPDQLLAALEREQKDQSRGQLKIFFGASPGVGKTYSMLEAARAKKKEGADVLVGVVETHNRQDTAALLEGLVTLPLVETEYRGLKLKEFDLDGALKRRPGLILVDELAHTNVQGSRHVKRWQDVQELLDNGIHVYTTLNVQHLESINDIVAQITGVQVKETLPDKVVEQADELELVDLAPEELLKRLQEGKVYIPEQARAAIQNFFKIGNLTALRELALRMTADRVNRQVQDIRREESAGKTWPTTERLLVCVSPSASAANLVRSAHRMAKSLRAEWIAVYIETPGQSRLPENVRNQAIQHLRLAEQLGAETAVLSGNDFTEEVMNYARERNITKIFVGKPRDSFLKRLFVSSPVDHLLRQSGEIDVYATRGDPTGKIKKPLFHRPKIKFAWPSYFYAVLVVAACTFIADLIFPYVAQANIIMVYFLGVLLLSSREGIGASAVGSVLSVLCFDYFFVAPRFSFAVSDYQYLFLFSVMLFTALSISNLTIRVRRQAEISRLRERRTNALYGLSRELAINRGTDDLLGIAVKQIAEVFESSVAAFLPGPDGRLQVRAGLADDFSQSPKEMAVAHWVFDLGQIAGKGTDTLPGTEALYVPLVATGEPVGVLGVKPLNPERMNIPEQLHLLEAFAHQTALAVAGDQLAEKNQQNQIQIETEQLRSSLLSSVSHDLRTPLAAITGSASSLLDNWDSLDAGSRKDLLENIYEETERLSRMVNNLLDMTRLESGKVEVHKEPRPVEEVVGSALSRFDQKMTGRNVTTHIPADLPMAPMDALLMELVIANLVDNALKYTPEKTGIDLSASVEKDSLILRVADKGPGIAPEDIEHLFDKFYRGKRQANKGGAGLGLAICKAIMDIHQGTIKVDNKPAGGAVFEVSLPLSSSQPITEAKK